MVKFKVIESGPDGDWEFLYETEQEAIDHIDDAKAETDLSLRAVEIDSQGNQRELVIMNCGVSRKLGNR
ncbi:hypothetical protein IC229_34700 [Spirosoma sp. BT702]|uniref:Uncharacterized protein n=1 Tax=Spirosoma profusum TaxID=2771354 RepID=A0A927GAU3_9BACT|nr:hypothetical protein [Spirosoma profusum]MBD2705801.1 hypothetical protein [Spirosoma profusum]